MAQVHYENLTDAIRSGLLAMPLAEYAELHRMETHAKLAFVSVFGSGRETNVSFWFEGAPDVPADQTLREFGYDRSSHAGFVAGSPGVRYSKWYALRARTNPRGKTMARKATRKYMRTKYEHCVKKLKPKTGKRGPYGICRAQMQRTYGRDRFEAALAAARRNPDRRGSVIELSDRDYEELNRSSDKFRELMDAVRARVRASERPVTVRMAGGFEMVVHPSGRIETRMLARANPSRFERLAARIAADARRRGYELRDPTGRGVAAAIGRAKYGRKRFVRMAKMGKRKARRNPGESEYARLESAVKRYLRENDLLTHEVRVTKSDGRVVFRNVDTQRIVTEPKLSHVERGLTSLARRYGFSVALGPASGASIILLPREQQGESFWSKAKSVFRNPSTKARSRSKNRARRNPVDTMEREVSAVLSKHRLWSGKPQVRKTERGGLLFMNVDSDRLLMDAVDDELQKIAARHGTGLRVRENWVLMDPAAARNNPAGGSGGFDPLRALGLC